MGQDLRREEKLSRVWICTLDGTEHQWRKDDLEVQQSDNFNIRLVADGFEVYKNSLKY